MQVKPEDFKTEEEMVNERLDPEKGSTPAPGPRIFLRKEDLFWIELDTSEEVPKQLEGLPMEAVVLSTNCKLIQGKGLPADGILQTMLSDEVKELRFIDDADWKELPAVGAALKKAMENEETTRTRADNRHFLYRQGSVDCSLVKGEQKDGDLNGLNLGALFTSEAVKLALALAVALQQEEILEEPPDLSHSGDPRWLLVAVKHGETVPLLFVCYNGYICVLLGSALMFLMFFRVFLWVSLGWHAARVRLDSEPHLLIDLIRRSNSAMEPHM
eukprot:s63_g29.t1